MKENVLKEQKISPKTKIYSTRTKFMRDIVTVLSKLMSRFYMLSSISNETEDRYYKVLRDYEKHTAIYVAVKEKISTFYTTTIFVVNFLVLGFVLPIFAAWYLNLNALITIVGIILSVFSLFLNWKLIPKMLTDLNGAKVFIVLATFALVFLSSMVLSRYLNWLVYLLLLIATIFFLGFAMLYIELFAFALVELFVKRWYIKQNPIAFIVDNYLEVLFLMEESAFSWTDKLKKQGILENLKDISNAMSWYLPKYIKLDNGLLSTLYLDKIDKLSSTIKYVEMKVLMPEEKKEYELYLKLTAQFKAFLSGYWGDFVFEESPKATRPQRFLYIWSLIKEFVVAVLPVSAILLFQQTPYAQAVSAMSYFVGLTLIWAVVRLIAIINPSALDGISKLKDITSLIPK